MTSESTSWISFFSHPMVVIGLVGQVMFFSRFLVQWIVSERRKESTIPVAFWFFSIAGGSLLLVYAIWRRDPVFILGQSVGVLIYTRNLMLIFGTKGKGSGDTPPMGERPPGGTS